MSDNEKQDLSALSGEQLQSAVQSVLNDPAFGRILSEIQGKSPEEAPAAPTITPEMMAKLPQMMAALSPLVGTMKEEKKESDGKSGSKSGGESEKRKRLLAALRPYLSESRRDAVDGILKVTEMTDLLSGLGQPGSKS